jgi:sugar phosphate isomerase/epimerase
LSSQPHPSVGVHLALRETRPIIAPETLKAWGCEGVELDGIKVASMSDSARQALRGNLRDVGLVTTIVTSTGDAREGWTLDTLLKAYALACSLDAKCVVTTAPPRTSPSGPEELQMVEWLGAASSLAEARAIPLLIENRPATWADTGQAFDRFIGQAVSPWVGVAFNPVQFVILREHPFLTSFMPSHMKSRIHLIRIQDAVFADGHTVPVNEGNAEVAELVSAVLARGFDGLFIVGAPEAGPQEVGQALADFRHLLARLDSESFGTVSGTGTQAVRRGASP